LVGTYVSDFGAGRRLYGLFRLAALRHHRQLLLIVFVILLIVSAFSVALRGPSAPS